MPEVMTKPISDWYITNGVLGITVLVLGYVVFVQAKENKALNKALIASALERLHDAKENALAYAALLKNWDEFKEHLLEGVSKKLRRGRESSAKDAG